MVRRDVKRTLANNENRCHSHLIGTLHRKYQANAAEPLYTADNHGCVLARLHFTVPWYHESNRLSTLIVRPLRNDYHILYVQSTSTAQTREVSAFRAAVRLRDHQSVMRRSVPATSRLRFGRREITTAAALASPKIRWTETWVAGATRASTPSTTAPPTATVRVPTEA